MRWVAFHVSNKPTCLSAAPSALSCSARDTAWLLRTSFAFDTSSDTTGVGLTECSAAFGSSHQREAW